MSRPTFNALFTALALLLSLGAAQAQNPACSAHSGAQTTALLELFTSEGCDSCPPADAWLSKQPASDKLIPIAWHVDYWDRLGWRDRFAMAYATERQRKLSSLGGLRGIYTPQTVVHGKSIYFSDGGDIARQQKAVNAQVSKTVLSLSIQPSAMEKGAKMVNVSGSTLAAAGGSSAGNISGAVTYLALVEDGLLSQVTAGENRGASLKHDRVVRSFAGPLKAGTFAVQLPVPADSKLARLSVVAWAEAADGQALQALNLASVALCSEPAK